jgi:N-acetylglucosamine-6-phosphate deacetylase
MRGAGLPEGGKTTLGRTDSGNAVLVEDGVAKLPDHTAFAGSVATGDRLFRTAIENMGVSPVEASCMLSATPARVMGYADRGEIAPGKRADLIRMDSQYQIKCVFLKGEYIQ